MLTKEQIKEFMDGPGGWPVMLRNREDTELFRELCRLALLGLERDERAERVGRLLIALGPNAVDDLAVIAHSNEWDETRDALLAIAAALEAP